MSKIWFITGCSQGFGRILTEELLKNTEDKVIATARRKESLDDLVRANPGRILAFGLDVMQTLDIQKTVAKGIEHFGRIDVLVNNAGYGLVGALEECTESQIRKIFETNVFGLMEVTRAVLPIMRSHKSGHILNISSVAGLVAAPGGGIYNSTKFAVEGFSEALALDVAFFGIKVTIIEPGPFRTNFAGGSIVMAQPMPEYNESLAFSARDYVEKCNGTQQGDPLKAARIMIQVAAMEKPPLRLPLGSIAVERIHTKNKAQTLEFERYETLARSADF